MEHLFVNEIKTATGRNEDGLLYLELTHDSQNVEPLRLIGDAASMKAFLAELSGKLTTLVMFDELTLTTISPPCQLTAKLIT